MKYLVGKIFISHSALDKRYVRRLADRIRREGFQIWLDEKDLVAGDALAAGISRAVESARVVLVVVSKNSVRSKWLKYELNLATDRMIKGHCRVIPVIIDGSPLPPEVAGLLYVEWRQSPRRGWRSLLTALQHEANRAAFDRGFWARAEVLLKQVFGHTSWVSVMGEFRSRDYSTVALPVQDLDGNEVEVPYEVVSAYVSPEKPLNERWWSEYIDATSDLPESIHLVVTERSVSFPVEQHQDNPRVGVRTLGAESPNPFIYRYIVVADVAGLTHPGDQEKVLAVAREALMQCASNQATEWRERRARARRE